jgi:hypothetical protein
MESNEFLRIAVKRGAAMVQIAVTNPVVINTTSTHPGTSPRSSFNLAKKESCIVIRRLRNESSANTAFSDNLFIITPYWLVGYWLVGCWLLVVGCWLLVVGCWLLVVGCWLLVVGCWLLVVGCWFF